MDDEYIGQIKLFPFDYAPHGWAECAGQLMSIARNQVLFAVIGARYGGDGTTNFALPDLRGRVPVHVGKTDSLTPQEIATETSLRSAAEKGSAPAVGTLTMNYCIAVEGYFPPRD